MTPLESTIFIIGSFPALGIPFALDMWYSFRYGRIYKYEVASITRRLVQFYVSHGIDARWVIPSQLAIYGGLVYLFYSATMAFDISFIVLYIGGAEHAVIGFGLAWLQYRKKGPLNR